MAVELSKASRAVPVTALLQRVSKRVAAEQELCLHPRLFHAVARHFDFARVSVQLKRGVRRNELTDFRYDVALTANVAKRNLARSEIVKWPELGNLAALEARLQANGTDSVLQVHGIPNARLLAVAQTLDILRGSFPPATVAELRACLERQAGDGVDPEMLWEIAARNHCAVEVCWSDAGLAACDATFYAQATAPPRLVRDGGNSVRSWSKWANSPLRGYRTQTLTAALRDHLQRALPEYMVPSEFVLLDALPVTPSGKLDREALFSAGDFHARDGNVPFVAPRNDIELCIAEIWANVLGLDRVSVSANFFALGGHSLLATQVMAKVRQAVRLDLPLRELFEHPTVAGLSQQVRAALESPGACAAEATIPRVLDLEAPPDVDQMSDAAVDELLRQLRDGNNDSAG